MDSETKKVLTEGEKIKLLTEHEGWGLVRDKLVSKIMELQTTVGLKLDDPQKLLVDVKARTIAAEMLFNWLKIDVEGTVEQHNNNNVLSKQKEDYILRE